MSTRTRRGSRQDEVVVDLMLTDRVAVVTGAARASVLPSHWRSCTRAPPWSPGRATRRASRAVTAPRPPCPTWRCRPRRQRSSSGRSTSTTGSILLATTDGPIVNGESVNAFFQTAGDATGVDADTASERIIVGIGGFATGRFTTPEEVATLVVLLASERTGNVTAANDLIDGGPTRTT